MEIGIVIRSGTHCDNLVFKPMIEKGSKNSTYTPYGTTPIELCKIGTYQDYFYKDSGKWYLHKEVGKVVLDGSESWQLFSVNNNRTAVYLTFNDILNYTEPSSLPFKTTFPTSLCKYHLSFSL